MRGTILPLCICIALLLPYPVLGDTPPQETVDEERKLKILKPLEKPKEAISDRIIRFSNWLDGFFGNDRAYQEYAATYLKVDLVYTEEENELPRYDINLRGKMSLPNTEDRFKLIIESEPEEGISSSDTNTPTEALEAQEQSVGLRYIPFLTKDWRVSTDLGVRYRDGADPFVRLRLRRLIPYENWLFRATQSFYVYESSGFGETSRLDMDRPIGEDYLFRSTSIATWLNENEFFDLTQTFSLFQKIDKYHAMLYQAGVVAESEPDIHATNYILSVRYRQQVHSNWLFFEINPRISYPEEEDFDPKPAISFTLQIIFGGIQTSEARFDGF